MAGIIVGVTATIWIGLGFLPSSRAERFAGRLSRVPKIGGQLLRRRVAAGEVLGHRLEDDRLQVAGDRRIEPARRGRLVQRDLTEQFLVVATVEGGL